MVPPRNGKTWVPIQPLGVRNSMGNFDRWSFSHDKFHYMTNFICWNSLFYTTLTDASPLFSFASAQACKNVQGVVSIILQSSRNEAHILWTVSATIQALVIHALDSYKIGDNLKQCSAYKMANKKFSIYNVRKWRKVHTNIVASFPHSFCNQTCNLFISHSKW